MTLAYRILHFPTPFGMMYAGIAFKDLESVDDPYECTPMVKSYERAQRHIMWQAKDRGHTLVFDGEYRWDATNEFTLVSKVEQR